MLVILAKFGSPVMLGQFSLGLASSAPVFMLTNLQLRGIQATDARSDYPFGDYLYLRLISTVLALVAIAGISLIGGYQRDTGLVILSVGCAKAFESISDVIYGMQQQHERMDLISRSMIIKGILSVAVLGVVVFLTGSVLAGTIALAFVWALVLLSYDAVNGAMVLGTAGRPLLQALVKCPLKNNILPQWRADRLITLTKLSVPLGLVMMLLSLNTNIPRYFIAGYVGEGALGIFSAIAYLIIAGNSIVNALGQAATPRLAKMYADRNRAAFRNLLFKLVVIGTVFGIAGVLIALLVGRQILSAVYRQEYAGYADVLLLLMVAAGVSYVASFLGYGMTAARYFKVQLPLFGLVTCVTFLTGLPLVSRYGLRGASVALIISGFVQVLASFGVVWHVLARLAYYDGGETSSDDRQ
jgi:O-antigen/teichoic acid export membrane protein